ncbi:flotillin family protein [Pelagibacterales bacterium SAG-MED06]|nr:flotillin family protein [Pelagibacterales bacterium SAG-MED50]MBD1168322.1 flotillin family protein [Pelagibacterales bacterium SAG-MED06]
MTKGADIIAGIILVALAIAIIVYLLHWLYRRSSKEVSFVRTGMLGEKVVISGGAFVLPIIHNITQVGMRTLSLNIKRAGDKSLITKDRMRAELVTEFFTKVPPEAKAVSTAAQTLGNRTLDPEHLKEVVAGRFADALGEVAAKMTLDEIQENRGQFVKQVANIANESIGHTGLALETVSIISLDQAPIEMFNPANTFDSQGLTQLTEQIEERKKKRNDITQDTKISIENKNLETVQKELEIKKNEEFSKYQQEREIAIQRAKEKTETIKEKAEKEREAEEAEIRSQEQIEVAKISQNQVIEVERKLTETRLIEEIEKRRKEQNELEKNSAFEIRQKDLETEVKILNLDKESEYARLEKQRQVDIKRAQEKAAIIKEQSERQKEAEEAQIVSEQQVKNAKIEQQKNIDSHRIESERVVRLLDIEKAKRLSIEEHQKNLEVINKSKQVLKSKAEEENSRARAIEAEEKANSARYVEKAQGIKKVDVITAASKAEQDRHATMAAKLRYEIDAAGKEALNSAENLRSDASRRSALRLKLADKIESIIRESVKPMANIGDIKIVDVNGLPGFSGTSSTGGGGGEASDGTGGSARSGNLADNVVSSALRYRAHQPFLDSLLKEIGMAPGEISNIRNILGDYENPKKDYHMNFDNDPTKGPKSSK